ncbi:MAG: antibiotic biosynthesis monooxygenase [Actinomycetota bacterium]
MSKIAMIITSTAQPGKRDDLFTLYRDHLAPRAEANPGQEVVVWCADQQDEDVFHLFEIYADGETLGTNAQSDFFAEYMAAAMPLLAGEPTVAMAEPRWSTGV